MFPLNVAHVVIRYFILVVPQGPSTALTADVLVSLCSVQVFPNRRTQGL